MSKTTTNFGLIKPELTDAADITNTNQNWDIIDDQLKDNGDRLDDFGDGLDALSADMISHKHLSNGFTGVIKKYTLNTPSTIASLSLGAGKSGIAEDLTPGLWVFTAKHATELSVNYYKTIDGTSLEMVFEHIPLPAILLVEENSVDRISVTDIATGNAAYATLNSDGNTYTVIKNRNYSNYTYGTDDLKAGTTKLETGKLYFVYE